MEAYKAGQGSLARLSAFMVLLLGIAMGCRELYFWIADKKDGPIFGLQGKLFESLPFFNAPLSVKFLICVAVFVLLVVALRRYMARPATVNALIETEAEMKKVAWPTREESWSASLVVIVVSILLTMCLFVFDQVLQTLLDFFWADPPNQQTPGA